MLRKPMVAGNWKMNSRRGAAGALAAAVAAGAPSGIEVLVCPPFPYLASVADALAGSAVSLGAQNLALNKDGAFTGEVSGEMLVDVGASHVLVGHSERRALFGETDYLVADKFVRALEVGLVPVLCVGETLEDREQSRTEEVVAAQLDRVIEQAGAKAFAGALVAYEPVWAIGTGKTASPEQAQAVHAFIRARLASHEKNLGESLRILYGGSVNADNAASLFGQPDIDGGLVGGASLDADSFLAICQAATAK